MLLVERERKKRRREATSMSGWTCPQCTFINSPQAAQCPVCSSLPAAPPQIEQGEPLEPDLKCLKHGIVKCSICPVQAESNAPKVASQQEVEFMQQEVTRLQLEKTEAAQRLVNIEQMLQALDTYAPPDGKDYRLKDFASSNFHREYKWTLTADLQTHHLDRLLWAVRKIVEACCETNGFEQSTGISFIKALHKEWEITDPFDLVRECCFRCIYICSAVETVAFVFVWFHRQQNECGHLQRR